MCTRVCVCVCKMHGLFVCISVQVYCENMCRGSPAGHFLKVQVMTVAKWKKKSKKAKKQAGQSQESGRGNLKCWHVLYLSTSVRNTSREQRPGLLSKVKARLQKKKQHFQHSSLSTITRCWYLRKIWFEHFFSSKFPKLSRSTLNLLKLVYGNLNN